MSRYIGQARKKAAAESRFRKTQIVVLRVLNSTPFQAMSALLIIAVLPCSLSLVNQAPNINQSEPQNFLVVLLSAEYDPNGHTDSEIGRVQASVAAGRALGPPRARRTQGAAPRPIGAEPAGEDPRARARARTGALAPPVGPGPGPAPDRPWGWIARRARRALPTVCARVCAWRVGAAIPSVRARAYARARV